MAFLFLLGWVAVWRAQEADAQSDESTTVATSPGPLHLPTPFVGAAGEADQAGANGGVQARASSSGAVALDLLAAQRALRLGFPSTAAVLYRGLLEPSPVAFNEGAKPFSPGEPIVGGSSPNADEELSDVRAESIAFQTMLRLGLVTALMDDGQFAEAATVLKEISEKERGAQWRLRAGLLAAAQRDFAEARRLAGSFKPEELPSEERAWALFLQGLIADGGGSASAARSFFEQAEEEAASPEASARFALARARGLLRVGEVSEAAAAEARRNMERLRGRTAGLHFARTYAAMLDALGRKGEAVQVLQQQLIALPATLGGERDDFQLLLGLIAGAESGAGRVVLRNLVVSGSDPAKQRAALQLLAQASASEGASGMGGAGQLERDLDQLLEAAPEHPILDDLLLVRAQLALGGKRYAQAERDARALLEKFPGSQRKSDAYGVLMSCAWEQFRYRAAADFATQASTVLPSALLFTNGDRSSMGDRDDVALQRFSLGVLVAEAWFRARDYPNAADAYAAVLREQPKAVLSGGALVGAPSPSANAASSSTGQFLSASLQAAFVGDLMFQRVLSEIEAGRLATAAAVLDELAADPRFDAINRWQAEWNLARALQREGRMSEAYARIGRLLGAISEPVQDAQALVGGASPKAGEVRRTALAAVPSPPTLPALPSELQARMRWLQARLSLLAGEPEETLRLADALTESMPEGVGEALAEELRSSCALLKAESFFRLGRREDAVALLQKVRESSARSTAAVQSLIVEAGYYATQGQTVEAQQLYTKLADDFPENATYAPYARYQAALQAERRGQDANLEEANKLIEQMVTRYPQSPLVFYARLKQGDLLRKLNQFPQAQQVYESLVNNYPQHPDVLLAQLALAECHNAQSMIDPAHASRALVLFEQLRDRVDAPVDVRVEAGLALGHLMLRGGQADQAEAVWWRDVVTAFLLDERMALQLGVRGRYWMTRTLLEVGALYERQARLDQARAAWELILTTGLPGAALAEDRLVRTGGDVRESRSGVQWRSSDGNRSAATHAAPGAGNDDSASAAPSSSDS